MSYSMSFQNFSKTSWQRSINGSTIDVALQNLTQSPGPVLQARSGLETLAADQSMLSFVAAGDLELYCCWHNPATSQRLGIKIIVPVQVFGMGYAPYWQIMQDTAAINASPKWIASGSDPSSMFQFDLTGFKIAARPEAGHSSLSINVTIEDN